MGGDDRRRSELVAVEDAGHVLAPRDGGARNAGGRGAPTVGRRPQSGTSARRSRRGWRRPPLAASHSSFSSSVQSFSCVVGERRWTLAIARSPPFPPPYRQQFWEALRAHGLRATGGRSGVPRRHTHGRRVGRAYDAATSLQPRDHSGPIGPRGPAFPCLVPRKERPSGAVPHEGRSERRVKRGTD